MKDADWNARDKEVKDDVDGVHPVSQKGKKSVASETLFSWKN